MYNLTSRMMRTPVHGQGWRASRRVSAAVLVCLALGAGEWVWRAMAPARVLAQSEIELRTTDRVFGDIGPGVTQILRDASGRYLVLTARGPLLIFSAAGERIGQVPAAAGVPAGAPATTQAPSRPAPAPSRPPQADAAGAGQPSAAPAAGKPDANAAATGSTKPDSGAGQAASSAAPSAPPAFVYASDVSLAPDGRIAIADRGANLVRIYTSSGDLERTVSAPAPNSVVALPEGEVAVTTASMIAPRLDVAGFSQSAPRLVSVYDARGKLVRQFGDPIDIAERAEVNRLLGFGRVIAAPKDAMYYMYAYVPEPTVRKFDRFGYSAQEIILSTPDFQPAAQAMRREIKRQDSRGGNPQLKPVLNAIGVDAAKDEVWIATGNVLHHLDREGTRHGSYRVFTKEGVRLEPVAILVEPGRLLLACDPLGIYVLPRPE